ncbi:MAG TPA: dihydroorotate dehydrogenase, partial [Candidatus Goldiibacteriota bacterium]|nr:dihydroorotate dehydrogenase [Candidatus Goldiibacteriota bacterium]
MRVNTTVNIGGLVLKNPVMTASGTFGYGLEFEEYVNLNKLGAIVVKGIALNPVKGNKPQRLVETPAGIMNAIGLQNVGVEAFISEKLPLLKKYSTPVIANIYGTDVDGYIKVAQRLNDSATAAVEINISCPNVKKGGLQFASDKDAIATMMNGIKKVFTRPVIVKLSPNTGNIEEMAQVCEDNGADAVSLINTLVGLSINLKTRRPNIANVFGGLSGPAIKPVALAMVHKVSKKIKIPIIGIGGIMNTTDALEFIVAGASAV